MTELLTPSHSAEQARLLLQAWQTGDTEQLAGALKQTDAVGSRVAYSSFAEEERLELLASITTRLHRIVGSARRGMACRREESDALVHLLRHLATTYHAC